MTFNAHIVIAGQSNANGQGDTSNADRGLLITALYSAVQCNQKIGTADTDPIPYTLVATGDLQPYHAGGAPGMGVELSLGRYFHETVASSTPFISKFGVSGSPITQWVPGSGFPVASDIFTQFTDYIDLRVIETGRNPDAIVWIQGEGDATNQTRADAYQTNLTTFVAALRVKYGAFQFVILKLNTAATGGGILSGARDTVRAAQVAYVAANPTNSVLVDSDGIPLGTDNLHYGADSLIILGNMLAEATAAALHPSRNSDRAATAAPWIQGDDMPAVASAGTILTPWLPIHEADDLIVVAVINSITNAAPTLTTANGFAIQGSTVVATNGSAFANLTVYTKVATAAGMIAPSITPGAGSAQAICLAFVVRNTDGIDATSTSAASTFASGSFTSTGPTTLTADSLVVFVQGAHAGNSTNNITGWADATLTGFAEIRDTIKAGGTNFPMIGLASGTKAVIGAAGSSSGSYSTAALWASMSIAFKPTPAPPVITYSEAFSELGYDAGAFDVGADIVQSFSEAFSEFGYDAGGFDVGSDTAQSPIAPTVASIRDRMIALTGAVTPALLSHDRFRAYRNEGDGDFRHWAETNPTGAFRRFQVRARAAGLTDTSSTAYEGRIADFTIMVAYPQNARTGKAQALDRDDAMSRDRHLLESATGVRGWMNFHDLGEPLAHWIGTRVTRERGRGVDFLVITHTMRFDWEAS